MFIIWFVYSFLLYYSCVYYGLSVASCCIINVYIMVCVCFHAVLFVLVLCLSVASCCIVHVYIMVCL